MTCFTDLSSKDGLTELGEEDVLLEEGTKNAEFTGQKDRAPRIRKELTKPTEQVCLNRLWLGKKVVLAEEDDDHRAKKPTDSRERDHAG